MLTMRNILHKVALPLAIVPMLAHAKDNPDEQGVRQTLARYETALNASDSATIANLYTKDGIQMAPDA